MRRLAIILCVMAAPLAAEEELERELKRLVEVFAVVEQHAAEPVSYDQLFYGGAIPGMLRQLDPHSVFFDRDQFEQLQEMERSMSKGFGSIVNVLPGRVIVLQVQPGSPASKAGLSPGDEIVAINNIPLVRLDLEQLIQVLGMTRQRQALIHVRRMGTAGLMTTTMTPAEMLSPSVDRVFTLRPGVGYVRATSFDGSTGKEIRAAIEKLGGASLKALVLDLRDNPGGVLPTALETAALFLPPGRKLLSARGRGEQEQTVDVPADAKPYEFAVAVLINGRTASGSEIVAGAIQDHDRGIVLGEPSFGKGLVQSVYPLSEGNGLALTTAFYYTPSGRSIQRPLRGTALGEPSADRPEFKTTGGRTVRGGGGIEPDHVVTPRMPSRFLAVLEASGAFAAFATEWLRSHRGEASRDMEITPAMLGEFQLWLSRRGIRPAMHEWTAEGEALRGRLKQEILNQSVGVEAGDEVEIQRDPVVLRALTMLGAR